MRATVFILWIIALTSLLLTERYTIFLRPEFGILLGLGILALAGFLLSGRFYPGSRPLGLLEIVRSGILILPLFFMLNSGEKLDSSAFRNRFLGPSLTTMVTEGVTDKGYSDISGGNPFESATIEPLSSQSDKIKEVTILDLTVAPKQYANDMVSVVGMVARSEDFNKIFKGDYILLFRFTINCCAADSVPSYALIQGDDLPDFQEDTWVKVQGVFNMKIVDQYSIPIINNAVMKKTEEPKIPYLF